MVNFKTKHLLKIKMQLKGYFSTELFTSGVAPLCPLRVHTQRRAGELGTSVLKIRIPGCWSQQCFHEAV